MGECCLSRHPITIGLACAYRYYSLSVSLCLSVCLSVSVPPSLSLSVTVFIFCTAICFTCCACCHYQRRRTRENTVKWNQMTTLILQTWERHQTSQVSLREPSERCVEQKTTQNEESRPLSFCHATGEMKMKKFYRKSAKKKRT